MELRSVSLPGDEAPSRLLSAPADLGAGCTGATAREQSKETVGKDAPSLSICIPTYNRADCLGPCLDSILSQCDEGIEVVIVDGASTDATSELVADYQRRYPSIRYYRRPFNVGIDEDVLKVVELAKGDYCWLMSDDDLMARRALADVRGKLNQYPGLAGASVNYASYDQGLHFRIDTVPALVGMDAGSDHLFSSGSGCFAALGMHLGYLSAQIVNRRLWSEIASKCDLTPYKKSSWLMVYVIGKMLERNPNWLYICSEIIKNRSANDSFAARVGEYNRQLITHEAFPRVIVGLFGENSDVLRTIASGMIAHRMPRNLAKLKANNASLGLQLDLVKLYTRKYWQHSVYWLFVFPLFLVPNFVFRIVRVVYLDIKRRSQGHPD